jgi:mono/diheme cytochrome c family protein
MSVGLVIGIQVALLGLLLFALTPVIRRRWPESAGTLALARSGALIIGITLVAISVTGGQTPMSAVPNPVANTVTSIDAGERLYQANCAACHGVAGEGGGPLASTTPIRPPSLKAHLAQHTDGDLFYWISNGLPGGMPAWSDTLSETDRWNVINYLRALNEPGAPAAVSSIADGSVDQWAWLLPTSLGLFFAVWLGAGLRRARFASRFSKEPRVRRRTDGVLAAAADLNRAAGTRDEDHVGGISAT